MTSRQARTERRAAERKAKKAESKRQKAAAALTGFVSQSAPEPAPTPAGAPSPRTLANRENAQHSTGPRSPTGKLASSRNSLQHGLASGTVIIPGEDPSEFEALLEDLLAEHQPATTTEELLIQEMAQSFWLSQRALRLQNDCFTANGIDEKRVALFLRYQTTHDRAFHKALTALRKLQKERALGFESDSKSGFVSQRPAQPPLGIGFVSQEAAEEQNFGTMGPSAGDFLRQNRCSEAA